MAVRLFAHELSDLCIGKPALRSLCLNDTVGDAISALKRTGESFLSVWSCHHSFLKDEKEASVEEGDCRCVGKICMVDAILFLSKQENLLNPGSALQTPVSALIPKINSLLVRHLEPHASLLEALDVVLEGVHNIVVAIHDRGGKSLNGFCEKKNNHDSTLHYDNLKYCWLTQEDIVRYLLNSIRLFSPTVISPINTLDVIETDNLLTIHYDDPAHPALELISRALIQQTSLAIIDSENKLIGEISPFTLNACDESVSAAIATLSAGDLMAYIDCGSPPEDLVQLVKDMLQEQNLTPALELFEDEATLSPSSSFCSTTSSDDEFAFTRNGKLGGYSARYGRRSEAIVCYPWSTLVAVMIQALAHRVSYVWVVEEDGSLSGIVTYARMLKVFRERIKSIL